MKNKVISDLFFMDPESVFYRNDDGSGNHYTGSPASICKEFVRAFFFPDGEAPNWIRACVSSRRIHEKGWKQINIECSCTIYVSGKISNHVLHNRLRRFLVETGIDLHQPFWIKIETI